MANLAEKIEAKMKASGGNSKIEVAFARFMCLHLGGDDRLKIYRKLASLLRNRFSLMDALDRIHDIFSDDGKNPGEPLAIAVAHWMRAIQNGESFSEALRGWAPPSERLMLSVGDVSHMDQALDNLIRVTEGVKRMVGPIVSASSYPAFLFCLVMLILWAIGAYMVPPMLEAAPNVKWTGVAKTLVDLSYFVQDYWWTFIVFPIVIFGILLWSMPVWKNRYRVFVDNVPPWSLYRVFIGVSWLLALAALVKAGTPVSKALRNLKNDASPYVIERVDKALTYITNGDNLGEALYKTKYNFPDKEIIGDLRIYSELDNFALALDQISTEWLNEAEATITTKAEVLNTAAILLVSAIVAWSVWGTFDMQDQLVKAMGMT